MPVLIRVSSVAVNCRFMLAVLRHPASFCACLVHVMQEYIIKGGRDKYANLGKALQVRGA